MARAGRTRKLGARQPNGELRRSRKIKQQEVSRTALHQRLKYIDPKHANKPEAGHLLGCLYLNDLLEHRQYVAAQKVAEHFARYRSMLGMPRASIQIIDLNAIFGTSDNEPDAAKIASIKGHMADIEFIIHQEKAPGNLKYPAKTRALLVDILERDEIPASGWQRFSWSPDYQFINSILRDFADLYKLSNSN
ncbi:MAG: hypothetical protein HRU29_01710 [Rhizobiales bacterium]|nr:hypothetical protein [Hyphomicrobiales bacterium]NRB13091.1 hypothetical protein [Hyphomicrobiales bacterium]